MVTLRLLTCVYVGQAYLMILSFEHYETQGQLKVPLTKQMKVYFHFADSKSNQRDKTVVEHCLRL